MIKPIVIEFKDGTRFEVARVPSIGTWETPTITSVCTAIAEQIPIPLNMPTGKVIQKGSPFNPFRVDEVEEFQYTWVSIDPATVQKGGVKFLAELPIDYEGRRDAWMRQRSMYDTDDL